MKIVDYHCISSYASETLGVRVGQCIMKGWQPFGGVSVSVSTDNESDAAELVYAQAMVKYDED